MHHSKARNALKSRKSVFEKSKKIPEKKRTSQLSRPFPTLSEQKSAPPIIENEEHDISSSDSRIHIEDCEPIVEYRRSSVVSRRSKSSSGFTVVNDYIMDRTVTATLLKFSCQLVD